MSVLDQIRKLEEQKQKLMADAKAEALARAEAAIRDLAELGFPYRLVAADDGRSAPTRTRAPRQGGVRETVLAAVKEAGSINRADLLVKLGAKGDKSKEQSISNALANMRTANILKNTDGNYSVA